MELRRPALDPVEAYRSSFRAQDLEECRQSNLGVGGNRLRSPVGCGRHQHCPPDDAGVPDSAPDLGDDGPAWQPLWHYDGGHLENYWDQGGVPDADPAPDGEGLPDLSLSDGELLASLDLGQVPDDDSLADYHTLAAGEGPADTPWTDLAAFSQLGAPGDAWTSLGPGGADWLDAYDGGYDMLDAYDGWCDSDVALVASPDVCDYGFA